jgi:hypothetical protein
VTLRLIFLILAFVSFVLSALGVSTPRGNLMAAGLAFWVLAGIAGAR